MSKVQIVSTSLLLIFLSLNFSIMNSWSKGVLIAVTEEIKEANGCEEETDRHTFHLDFILTTNSDIESIQIFKNTNCNYISLHDFRGNFFVPDLYSPPDYI